MIQKLKNFLKRKGIYIGYTRKFKAPKKIYKPKKDKDDV